MGDSTLSGVAPYAVDAPHVFARPRPPSFVREQSAGTLLRAVWGLYRSYFSPLCLGYVIPTLSMFVLQQLGTVYEIGWLVLCAFLAGNLLAFVASSATTLMISDVCLGNSPSLRRSYRKLFERRLWLRVIGTVLLQATVVLLLVLVVPILAIALVLGSTSVPLRAAAVVLGSLLTVVGLTLVFKLMFSATIVVLERLSGYRALQRSMALVKGHACRVLGNVCLVVTVLVSAVTILALVVTVPLMALKGFETNRELAMLHGVFIGAVINGLFYPVLFITVILLYYDLRVRKEAYDVTILAEDVMR
jgi:hypothetical protein